VSPGRAASGLRAPSPAGRQVPRRQRRHDDTLRDPEPRHPATRPSRHSDSTAVGPACTRVSTPHIPSTRLYPHFGVTPAAPRARAGPDSSTAATSSPVAPTCTITFSPIYVDLWLTVRSSPTLLNRHSLSRRLRGGVFLGRDVPGKGQKGDV
jgi:hypothetical protein